MVTLFAATATTCNVAPGEETTGSDGAVHIRRRVFTDIVACPDQRVAGVNTPTLDLDINPADGSGALEGRFVLRPERVDGSWEGDLKGQIRGGMVSASGLARGTGTLAGTVMRVDFRQLKELSGPSPCPNPLAFFAMEGMILERD